MDRPVAAGDAQLLVEFLRRQPAVVAFVQAFGIEIMQIGAQAAFLFRVARRAVEHAALAVVAVDAFLLQHPRDLVGNPV